MKINTQNISSSLGHLVVWLALYFFMITNNFSWGWAIGTDHDTAITNFYGLISNAIIFYGTVYFLIPRFYNRKQRKVFFLFSFLLLAMITIVEFFLDQHFAQLYQSKNYMGTEELTTFEYVLDGLVYIIPVNVIYYILAFAFRLPKDRRLLHERESELRREKLEAELKFLKAQVHPHTLFNGMSNIYHLIETEPQKAKALVLNLSNALRYQLYESGEQWVSLEKELTYLKQYIALQQIRIDEEAIVDLSISNFEGDFQVAPLLFTPFIENAFKYISHFPERDHNKIRIHFEMIDADLQFECVNTTDANISKPNGVGGIGLKNAKNRLQLLYPNQYQLEIVERESLFTVRLTLPLHEIKPS